MFVCVCFACVFPMCCDFRVVRRSCARPPQKQHAKNPGEKRGQAWRQTGTRQHRGNSRSDRRTARTQDETHTHTNTHTHTHTRARKTHISDRNKKLSGTPSNQHSPSREIHNFYEKSTKELPLRANVDSLNEAINRRGDPG